LRGGPGARRLKAALLWIGALAYGCAGPARAFALRREPGGWTLTFRPALAAAAAAPEGEWVWLAFQREGRIEALALDGRSGQVQAHLRLETSVCCLPPPLAMTPDGRLALVGGHEVGAYGPGRGGRILFRLEPPDSAVALAVAPDGRVAVIATLNGWVILFDPWTGRLLRRWEPAPGRRASPGIAFTPDGQELWIAWNERLEAWALPTGSLRAARGLPFQGTMVMVAISEDGAGGLVLGDAGSGWEGWWVRRGDLSVEAVIRLGALILPRLQAAGDGFQIDSVGEPLRLWARRDGRVERIPRGPSVEAPVSREVWIEDVYARGPASGPPWGWLAGAHPPLADRFHWITDSNR